jgi:hypothetical protein
VTIQCPHCRRPFDTDNDLRQHLAAKVRVSATHTISAAHTVTPRPRSVAQEQYEAAWRVKESLRR